LLKEGRIPLTAAEHDAVEALIAKHPDEAVSITRRDPGETGPVLVHVGDATYEISQTGRASTRKQRKKASG
jgi:hypothetical protein